MQSISVCVWGFGEGSALRTLPHTLPVPGHLLSNPTALTLLVWLWGLSGVHQESERPYGSTCDLRPLFPLHPPALVGSGKVPLQVSAHPHQLVTKRGLGL